MNTTVQTNWNELWALVKRAASTPADPSRLDQVDHDLVKEASVVVDRFCRAWFQHDVQGLERIPKGSALIVGNHNSGVTFLEGLGFGARAYLAGGWDTPWHALTHDAVVDMPMMGAFLTRVGAIRASHETANAAFEAGRKLIVFPGGNLEAFRPWRERHQIKFGGHKGFVRLALRHQVPIAPTVFYGGHNGFFVLSDNRGLAKRLGAKRFLRSDTWPVFVGLPWGVSMGPLFHMPLPVPCTTRVLDPIDVPSYGDASAVDDPEVVDAIYNDVVAAMQAGLDALRAEARPVLGPARGLVKRVLDRG